MIICRTAVMDRRTPVPGQGSAPGRTRYSSVCAINWPGAASEVLHIFEKQTGQQDRQTADSWWWFFGADRSRSLSACAGGAYITLLQKRAWSRSQRVRSRCRGAAGRLLRGEISGAKRSHTMAGKVEQSLLRASRAKTDPVVCAYAQFARSVIAVTKSAIGSRKCCFMT